MEYLVNLETYTTKQMTNMISPSDVYQSIQRTYTTEQMTSKISPYREHAT